MNVHQLSFSYVAEQDRILARVNTQEGRELQFWITRRLALGITPLIERAVAEQTANKVGVPADQLAVMDALAKKSIAEFRRGESLKQADFATPYKSPVGNAPMFEQPLLVTEMNLAPLKTGHMRMRCSEKLGPEPGNRRFEMVLSEQLAHAFAHLLERALQQSQWREVGIGAMGGVAAQDPSGNADKPGYLN